MSSAPNNARLGYLLSKYPSENHTYLLHEVRGLRARELDVLVVSIDADERTTDGIPAEDRDERARTFVVKTRGVAGIVADHVATAITRPLMYAKAFAHAMSLAGADLKRIVAHVMYFGEAVIAGRYLWQGGCTHVHTHYASTVAVIAARVYPFEISATIHGSAEFIDPRAQRLREKIAACAFVRAISMYGRSQLMLASPVDDWTKLHVIRLGVDPSAFAPMPQREASSQFRMAAVGQLQPAKGFHVLLEAVATLVRAGRDVALTLVGDGVDRESLEAHVVRLSLENSVTFTGTLTQPGVRAVLRETDVFVLSSFAEGIPVVLMEAMACGIACVASRITGIPELIEDQRDGLLVSPSDERALAAALAALMDDPAMRHALGVAGRARICREYDGTTNVGPLAEMLAARLDGRP